MAICHHTCGAVEETQLRGKKRTDPSNENSKQVMMKHFPSDHSTEPQQHFARWPGAQLRNTGAEIHLSNRREERTCSALVGGGLCRASHLTRATQHPDGWPAMAFVDESVIYIHVRLIIQTQQTMPPPNQRHTARPSKCDADTDSIISRARRVSANRSSRGAAGVRGYSGSRRRNEHICQQKKNLITFDPLEERLHSNRRT